MAWYFIRKKSTGTVYAFDSDTGDWLEMQKKRVSREQVPPDVMEDMIRAAERGDHIVERDIP